MKLRILLCSALICLAGSLAWASPFDGMDVDEITSHSDFVSSDYSLSRTTNSGDAGAPQIYKWIGYIPSGDKRVYFTSFGEALTCVEWQETGEWVPEWVVDALDQLVESGHITFP